MEENQRLQQQQQQREVQLQSNSPQVMIVRTSNDSNDNMCKVMAMSITDCFVFSELTENSCE